MGIQESRTVARRNESLQSRCVDSRMVSQQPRSMPLNLDMIVLTVQKRGKALPIRGNPPFQKPKVLVFSSVVDNVTASVSESNPPKEFCSMSSNTTVESAASARSLCAIWTTEQALC